MTAITKLYSLGEVEICCKYGGEAGKLARQLVAAMRELEATRQLNDSMQQTKKAMGGKLQELMRENERLVRALKLFGGGKDRVVEEFYDCDCIICGFNAKRADNIVNKAIDSCKHSVEGEK